MEKFHDYYTCYFISDDEFDYNQESEATDVKTEKHDAKESIKQETTGNEEYLKSSQSSHTNGYQSRKRPKQLLTEKIANEKKKEIEKEIKAAKKKRPKNLLFTTGYSSEESLESEDEKSVI